MMRVRGQRCRAKVAGEERSGYLPRLVYELRTLRDEDVGTVRQATRERTRGAFLAASCLLAGPGADTNTRAGE